MDLLAALLLVLALRQSHAAILNLKEGDKCEALGGSEGTCELLTSCRNPGDFKREHPPICRFKGREPIICCPRLTSPIQEVGSKIRAYCDRVSSACRQLQVQRARKPFPGVRRKRAMVVVGGTPSAPRKRLYMVLIGYGRPKPSQWACGGSLITTKFVLSAAHCAYPEFLGPARWVRAGELVISSSDDDANPQDKEIAEIIVHPSYTNRTVYNDIALFRLKESVQVNAWVGRVCLQVEPHIAYQKATVSGWGRVDFAGQTSDSLLEAELDIFNDTDCRTLLPTRDNKSPRGIDSQLMFCAGKRDGSKDACSGDSGGPLVTISSDNCLITQIGITSYGDMCGLPNSPGVYTRVSNYIPWIEGIAFANPNDL